MTKFFSSFIKIMLWKWFKVTWSNCSLTCVENRATSFVAGNWTHWPEIGPTKRAAIFVETQVKKVLRGCQLYSCFLNTEATFSVNFSWLEAFWGTKYTFTFFVAGNWSTYCIFRHWNCFLSSVALDDKDGNGLKVIFKALFSKITKNIIMVSSFC